MLYVAKLCVRKVLWFIGFYHNIGNFRGFAFDKNEKTFGIFFGTQNGTYKTSREKFVVCRKSMKTTNMFSRIAFIVYSINYILMLALPSYL